MKTLALLTTLAALISCAHSDLYRNGQRIAHFEGDMTGLNYHDGDVSLTGNVIHSTATEAQQKGAASNIAATGTALAAVGIATLLK